MPVKVYVVEQGCYENRGVVGVYASAEAAMLAHPIPADYRYPETPTAFNASRPGGWKKTSETTWGNGLDWDLSCEVIEYELEV